MNPITSLCSTSVVLIDLATSSTPDPAIFIVDDSAAPTYVFTINTNDPTYINTYSL
jgi:hypothetical protein